MLRPIPRAFITFCERRNERAARRSQPGFSLVELLVVIGIIAVLVSVLMPAFTTIREQSRVVTCSANLRQIWTGEKVYESQSDGFTVPAGVTPDDATYTEYWFNTLVNLHCLPAPDSTNQGPQTNSIFFCPSGIASDFLSPNLENNASVPASRTDLRGAMDYRWKSVTSGISVDCWYGINADIGNSSRTMGLPCRAMSSNTLMLRSTVIKHPENMVMFFDGLVFHLEVNANRVNARHNGQTTTNLAFFDGHVELHRTADLPGGIGVAPQTTFTAANLKANYPNGPFWLLDQDQ